MALKNILVHVTETRQSELRLETAVALCVAHDAHLTGLIVRAMPVLPAYSVGPIPDMVLEPFEAQQDAAIAKARETFDTVVKHAGWTDRSSCLQTEGNATDIVGIHARYADLTVTGQDMPDEDQWEISTVDLILRSGRPVLVTPHGTENKPIGKRIVIAWNASREAARAVADAVPLLETADSVEILTVAPQSRGEVPGVNIAKHLAHHGIAAEVKRLGVSETDAGEALLNYIENNNADLLVMGAYGHSRLREFVFGGTTRHVLRTMTIPVLMSH
ncbi:MAG: universal stress protein [Alphaproteobacteria bacterium]|nr:universal stress protein [Alphaproteobacteria bacterium]